MSTNGACHYPLSFKDEQFWILEEAVDFFHELVGGQAVDDAVVEGDGDADDFSDDDLVILDDWFFLDAVDTEDGDFRVVDDWGRKPSAFSACAGNRKGAAAKLMRFELSLFGTLRKLLNFAGNC